MLSDAETSRLLTTARQAAARWGEHEPREICAVRTTRGAAEEIVLRGSTTDARRDEAVYVIAMRGCFRAERHPVNVPPAEGPVMVLILGASPEATATSVGISPDFPDLGTLGDSIPLA